MPDLQLKRGWRQERERERETDRQTDRQTDTERKRERERERQTDRDREREGERDRETEEREMIIHPSAVEDDHDFFRWMVAVCGSGGGW